MGTATSSRKRSRYGPACRRLRLSRPLIHELAHALLHSKELPRSKEVAEVEVESVAYIVCDAIGLNSGDYSFAYVARWADGAADLLKETGARVVECSRRILERLEPGRVGRDRLSQETAVAVMGARSAIR